MKESRSAFVMVEHRNIHIKCLRNWTKEVSNSYNFISGTCLMLQELADMHLVLIVLTNIFSINCQWQGIAQFLHWWECILCCASGIVYAIRKVAEDGCHWITPLCEQNVLQMWCFPTSRVSASLAVSTSASLGDCKIACVLSTISMMMEDTGAVPTATASCFILE